MRQIAFGDNSEVVIINDGNICGKSNPVQAFVIDTFKGALSRQTSWSSNCWPYIFSTAKGNYAAVTSEGMSLYSPGLKTVLAKAQDAAAELSSPDGRIIAAWKQVPSHGVTYFLNADDLRPIQREFLDKNVLSVSANRIGYVVTKLNSTNQVWILDDGESKPTEIATQCGLTHARFLSTDRLAILGCNHIQVFAITGAMLFQDEGYGFIGDSDIAAISRDGNRFAMIQSFHTEGDIERICAERITVFDVQTQKPVFVVDRKELAGFDAHAHSSGVSLSPDGAQLVIDSEGLVSGFQLSK